METHYVPAFAPRGPGGSELAICGTFVTLHKHAAEPTCPDCIAVIAEEDRQLAELGKPSDPSLLVPHVDFDPTGGRPRGAR